jgi:hypothetical protein
MNVTGSFCGVKMMRDADQGDQGTKHDEAETEGRRKTLFLLGQKLEQIAASTVVT